MDRDIEQHIRSLSNADLLQYLEAPAGTYLPEAIAFARQEADTRHLSTSQLREAEEEIAACEAKRIADANASVEQFKLYHALGGLPAIVWVFPTWLTFKRQGKLRKASQLLGWWLTGLVLQVITGILLYLYIVGRSS